MVWTIAWMNYHYIYNYNIVQWSDGIYKCAIEGSILYISWSWLQLTSSTIRLLLLHLILFSFSNIGTNINMYCSNTALKQNNWENIIKLNWYVLSLVLSQILKEIILYMMSLVLQIQLQFWFNILEYQLCI